MHKFPRQRDCSSSVVPYAGGAFHLTDGVLGNGIVAELIAVHTLGKGAFDTGTFLIYGVVEWIDEAVYRLTDDVFAHPIAHLAIQGHEFLTIVA